MTVPALGALNKFAGVCVLACAVLFFIAPQAASEPARPETEGLRANRALAALGYPGRKDDPEWSEQTEGNALLFLLRLNRANDRVARHELLQLLESAASAGGPPCLEIAAAAPEGAAMQKVDITFRGDRPDEYLAEFYLQAATCYPEILAPGRAMDLFARAAAEKLRSFAPMPVSRTERARATYARALSALAAAGSRSEGRSRLSEPPLDAPAVAVRFEHARHRKLVRRQDGGFDARKTEESPAKEPPAAGELAAACAELALPAECAEFVNIKPIRDTYGEIATYAAELNHFNLVLTMEAPEELAEPLLFDLIARVRQQHPALQERGGVDTPFFTFAERKYVPLSVNTFPTANAQSSENIQHAEPSQYCKRPETGGRIASMECEKLTRKKQQDQWTEHLRIFKGSLTAIGAVDGGSNGNSQPVEVLIPDDGFDSPPDKWEAAICNGPIDGGASVRNCWESLGIKLKDKWLDPKLHPDIDGFGHGLHVSNMIAGDRAAFAIGNLPDRVTIVAPKRPQAVPIIHRTSRQGAVVNRSYMPDPNQSSNSGDLNVSEILSVLSETNTNRALSVFALPRYRNQGIILCGAPANAPDFCATTHEIAIGVAPVAPLNEGCGDDSAAPCSDPQNWRLVETEEVKVETSNLNGEQTERSETEYYYYEATTQPLLIAAPGHRLLGADATVKQGTNENTKAIEHMGFRARSGSSVAAPLVSAIAAKVMSKKNVYDPRIVKQWLLATSSPLGHDNDAVPNNTHWSRVAGIVHEARALAASPKRAVVFRQDNSASEYEYFEIHQGLLELVPNGKNLFAIVRDGKGIYFLLENPNYDCQTIDKSSPCVQQSKYRIESKTLQYLEDECGLTKKLSNEDELSCIKAFGANSGSTAIYLNQNNASHIIGIRLPDQSGEVWKKSGP